MPYHPYDDLAAPQHPNDSKCILSEAFADGRKKTRELTRDKLNVEPRVELALLLLVTAHCLSATLILSSHPDLQLGKKDIYRAGSRSILVSQALASSSLVDSVRASKPPKLVRARSVS